MSLIYNDEYKVIAIRAPRKGEFYISGNPSGSRVNGTVLVRNEPVWNYGDRHILRKLAKPQRPSGSPDAGPDAYRTALAPSGILGDPAITNLEPGPPIAGYAAKLEERAPAEVKVSVSLSPPSEEEWAEFFQQLNSEAKEKILGKLGLLPEEIVRIGGSRYRVIAERLPREGERFIGAAGVFTEGRVFSAGVDTSVNNGVRKIVELLDD